MTSLRALVIKCLSIWLSEVVTSSSVLWSLFFFQDCFVLVPFYWVFLFLLLLSTVFPIQREAVFHMRISSEKACNQLV